MPGWEGESPGRRLGLTVLLGAMLVLAAGAVLIPFLLTPATPIEEVVRGPEIDCERVEDLESPVAVESGLVLSCPDAFDGVSVTVTGEAIGDLFNGPAGRRWVQVNDDVYSRIGPLDSHHQRLGTNSGVAVLLPRGTQPEWLGGPGVQGDLVVVTGEFQAASAADQGGPAIIANAYAVQRGGGPAQEESARRLFVATPIMLGITLLLLGAVWLQRRRVYD